MVPSRLVFLALSGMDELIDLQSDDYEQVSQSKSLQVILGSPSTEHYLFFIYINIQC